MISKIINWDVIGIDQRLKLNMKEKLVMWMVELFMKSLLCGSLNFKSSTA